MLSQNRDDPAVFAGGLSVNKGMHRVLEGITFTVESGEMIGITGPNGGGKTTLLRTLLGLEKPFAGRSALLGSPSWRLGPVREKIGYVPQNRSHNRRFPLSVSDVVRMGFFSSRTLLKPLTRSQLERCRETLETVGVLPLAARPFGDLSGGEQQRVLLARSLVRRPLLLLLDEPATGLDPAAQRSFMEVLRHLQNSSALTVLLVSHDFASMAAYVDRLLCINRSMHIHGDPQQALHSSFFGNSYRCSYDLLCPSEEKPP